MPKLEGGEISDEALDALKRLQEKRGGKRGEILSALIVREDNRITVNTWFSGWFKDSFNIKNNKLLVALRAKLGGVAVKLPSINGYVLGFSIASIIWAYVWMMASTGR